MTETFQTCPYTGLRSFTEEESIYFKGRDEDIDLATAQLQRNKFLMLTGASGDGKSSLIYAGIIPNARAGFLKSQYSRWCVADFRPERTPFLNLCQSVAKQLDIPAVETVQAELSHGFSALADLYRNSARYVDTQNTNWQEADSNSRASIKREAANLLILVDQFEEFFTNPENYSQGTPSKDASLVLNLLLETARIALDEDLPIYIVFTMRSDYIGQCAAFRGLPEYLGFSQYFVPRLNRTQLQQVIEEPAVLNANSITRRLTERLIHDVTEGVDQLPILQHALNQIWIAAGNGTEEMDLIHYAMVGGLNPAELPDEQVSRFSNWFDSQSAVIRSCYHAPSLQNVLDTHCNKLFEQSFVYYQENTGKAIAEADAKAIIRIVFTCLTKIDQGRAVRNRMTLQEITDIAGNPKYNAGTIADVINIFREPGNTFIHPFISEEHPEHNTLQPEQILDITHESLIRNWLYLGIWAKEEFDSYSVSKDFEQQLSRWVNSNKSKDFLLSIGQLTYFETWYKKAKPNAYWIARYLDASNKNKLAIAGNTLADSTEFLNRSARKYIVTRKFMQIGPKRIAAVLAGLVVVFLSSFMISGYYRKQNNYLLDSIHKESLSMAANPKVGLGNKAGLIVEELKMGMTTVDEAVFAVKDPMHRIHFANGLGVMISYTAKQQAPSEGYRSLFLVDSLLDKFVIHENDGNELGLLLKEVSDLRVGLEFAFYYNPIAAYDSLRKRNGRRSAKLVKLILEKQPGNFTDINQLNCNLDNALNQKAFGKEEILSLLQILSPFENGLQTPWLKDRYKQDNIMFRGATGYGFQFNGLYQELAYLYAASGNTTQISNCIDSLMVYSQNYYQGDYATIPDNAGQIAFLFYNYDQWKQLDVFAELYSKKKKITQEDFYARLLGNAVPSNATTSSIELFFWGNTVENLSIKFIQREPLRYFFNKYRDVVQSQPGSADEKNFLTAMSFKNEGVLKSMNNEKPAPGDLSVENCFDQSISHYRKVNGKYLDQIITSIGSTAAEEIRTNRKALFIYPDLRTQFHPLEPRSFFFFNLTPVFIEYLLNKQLFEEFYKNTEEISLVADWLESYNSKQFAALNFYSATISYQTLRELDAAISKMSFAKQTDFNILYLYGGREAQKAGDSLGMVNMYEKVQPQNLLNILFAKEFDGNIANQSFRMIGLAVKGLFEQGRDAKAAEFIRSFKNPVNRSSLYAYAAFRLQRERHEGPLVQRLIDSARMEITRADITTQNQPNREMLAAALAMKPSKENIAEAFRLLKNIPAKYFATGYICDALSFNGKLFEARNSIPELMSDADLSGYYRSILHHYNLGAGNLNEKWKSFDDNLLEIIFLELTYVDESN